jgi:phosphoribosylaminoimidazole carboxylase PurE protein
MSAAAARVAIVLGSDSDLDAMRPCLETLDRLGIGRELRILSAHRAPEALRSFVRAAPKAGVRVWIAAAGGAAHLPGVIASQTTLPVIGVPMDSPMGGWDSLHSIVSMPGGVPVATVGLGPGGAKNAALLAAQVLALTDASLAAALEREKRAMAEGVLKKDAAVRKAEAAR